MASMPSRAAWAVALGLSLGPGVSNGLARFAYGLILPAMRQDLSWTYAEAGWINTANAIGYLIGALLALQHIDRTGPRRLFVGGLVLTTLALLASGLTRDFWLQSLWRTLAGIGGAPVFIAGGAMVATLFKGDPARNALAIAIYFGGGGIGMFFSGLLIPVIIDRLGVAYWPSTWLLLAGLSAIAFVPAAMAARAVPLPAAKNLGTHRAPLPIAPMSSALAGYFLFAVGYIVYLTFLVAWMRSNGVSAQLTAATWGVLGAAVIISPFPWRSIMSKSAGGEALALSSAATGAGTLLPLLMPNAAGLLLSAAVFGVSFFIAPASVTSFGRKNLPEASWGRSVALFTTAFAIGQALGPVAAGYIADTSHRLTVSLLAAGLTLLLAAAIARAQRPLRL